ncbi:glycoside hydrolase family 15 protein [Streptomyces sp. NPDC012508]|uniref:glycoside hydrolase family 15 protein n=1 Tax=Streptomyces sp. NPDC012508 TaxID=3364837 RepID=UPI003698B684
MSEGLPLVRQAGYLPLEDHGLIGDGSTCALVGRDGSTGFLCVPRFDSPALVCPLLDRERGGAFHLTVAAAAESRQYYVPGTGVLVTEIRSTEGTVRITDTMLLRPGAALEEDAHAGTGTFLRLVEVVHGRAEIGLRLEPRGGASIRRAGEDVRLAASTHRVELLLRGSRPLPAWPGVTSMREGDRCWVCLQWEPGARPPRYADGAVAETIRVWRRWSDFLVQDVPHRDLVHRSAITLKLLDYFANGAIVAAATSSLPERIGGDRNWDYRYAWVRDAAYTVFALRRIGLPVEAGGFLTWVLDAVENSGGPRVVYDIDGRPAPAETIDPELEGYRRSSPVRWGNDAAHQVQHDAYGEILDCAFQWAATGGSFDARLWERLRSLAEAARTAWARPDHGIWEVRSPARPFTYSAAMCQVALDRAARLSRRLHLPGDPRAWEQDAEAIKSRILSDAWDPALRALTEHLSPDGGLDASLLGLPLRRVLPADHPKMIATCRAVAERLDAGGGLLYRYLPAESPDGVGGREGAFVLCGFWHVDNLVGQGRLAEATELFERLCAYTNPLGLLPEQIDPGTGAFLGNVPQALSHVGLISSAVLIGRTDRGLKPELSTQAWFE